DWPEKAIQLPPRSDPEAVLFRELSALFLLVRSDFRGELLKRSAEALEGGLGPEALGANKFDAFARGLPEASAHVLQPVGVESFRPLSLVHFTRVPPLALGRFEEDRGIALPSHEIGVRFGMEISIGRFDHVEEGFALLQHGACALELPLGHEGP